MCPPPKNKPTKKNKKTTKKSHFHIHVLDDEISLLLSKSEEHYKTIFCMGSRPTLVAV